MSRYWGAVSLLLMSACAALLACGCASQSSTLSPRATLALDQIPPPLAFPESTRADPDPDSRPPLDALELFARGRVQMIDGDVVGAIDSLTRAVQLDPESYELHRALGKALRESPADQPRALEAFQRAAELEPTRLDAQIDLGREYLTHREAARALKCLRLTVATPEYRVGDSRCDEADFLLAAALRENGYLRAATDRLQLLATRLARGRDAAGPRMMRVQMQLGDLYLLQHRPVESLAAYRAAQATRTGAAELPITERIINVLLAARRMREAEQTAAQAVLRFNASDDSIALLRKTCRFIGRPKDAVTLMASMCREQPRDPLRLFALCQIARADNNLAAADRVLAELSEQSPTNAAVLVRRFELAWAKKTDARAVELVIDAVAAQPELFDQLGPIWVRLLSPEGRRRLSATHIERLASIPSQAAAKEWIAWRVDQGWPAAMSEAPVTSADEAPGGPTSINDLTPSSDAAFAALHQRYVRLRQFENAEAVLAAWQRAWPPDVPNPQLLLLRARRLMAEERFEAAELTLAELQQHDPGFPGLDDALRTIHARSRRAAVGAAFGR